MLAAVHSHSVSCKCPGDENNSGCKYARRKFVEVVLEPPDSSEPSTDESYLTMQGEETGSAKDESDTSSSSEEEPPPPRRLYYGNMSRLLTFPAPSLDRPGTEFDVPSLSEDSGDPLGESENSSGMDNLKVFPGVIAAKLAMEDSDSFLGDSSQDSSGRPDSELSMTDYWSCVQCNEKNNNPLFRFCERCYKGRKGFFPPRPFPIKTRDDLKEKRNEKRSARMKRKKQETSDLSSGEDEESVYKKQKLNCSQLTDSGISSCTQETLSQDVALSLHCSSVLERLSSGVELGGCRAPEGVDVVDGVEGKLVGNDSRRGTVGDDSRRGTEADDSRRGTEADDSRRRTEADDSRRGTVGDDSRRGTVGDDSRRGTEADDSRRGTEADDSRRGTEADDSRRGTEAAGGNEPPDGVVRPAKRPAAESCGDLRNASVLGGAVPGTSRDAKRPALVSPASAGPCRTSAVDASRACTMCCSQPMDGIFVHGFTGHSVACYSCALHIWKKFKTCPVCKLKISKVIKLF